MPVILTPMGSAEDSVGPYDEDDSFELTCIVSGGIYSSAATCSIFKYFGTYFHDLLNDFFIIVFYSQEIRLHRFHGG